MIASLHNNMAAAPRILIVDDEQDFARGLARLITGRLATARVEAVFSGTEALQRLGSGPVQLMITDLRMPDESGIALIRRLREHTSRQHLPVIVISGNADMDDVSDLLRLQVLDFFRKPIYHVRLIDTLDNLFPKPNKLHLVAP